MSAPPSLGADSSFGRGLEAGGRRGKAVRHATVPLGSCVVRAARRVRAGKNGVWSSSPQGRVAAGASCASPDRPQVAAPCLRPPAPGLPLVVAARNKIAPRGSANGHQLFRHAGASNPIPLYSATLYLWNGRPIRLNKHIRAHILVEFPPSLVMSPRPAARQG